MPEPQIDRIARLLPEPIRSEAFLPARQDLRASAFGRLRYTAAALVLLCQCWWLAYTTPTPSARLPFGDRLMQCIHALIVAVRQLKHQPGFAVAAVLTLALGVGANVAVFSVVEAVLLRPLPYSTSNRLVMLQHRDERTGLTKPNIAVGDFIEFRDRLTSFDQLVAYSSGQTTVFGPGDPEVVDSVSATAGLAEALGMRQTLGRLLTADDARPEAARVALLGHSLWTNIFGSDPHIIGRRISFGQFEHEVVGISAPGFRFPPTSDRETAVIFPLRMSSAVPANRRAGWPLVFGLVKPQVALETASAELTSLAEQFERSYPADNAGIRYAALPIRDALLGATKQPLLLLLGAVVIVLMIACANVGNLLLARAVGRRQEMALRVALGAGRGRLLIQLGAESLVLALIAALAGILVAYWGVPALVALIPTTVAAPGLADVGLNTRVLVFAVCLSLLSAFVFSAITALTVQTEDSRGALVGQGRISTGGRARRASGLLVVSEVAFAVVLIVGAGLVIRTLGNLLDRDPGFRTQNVLTMSVSLPTTPGYQSVEGRQAFWSRAWNAMTDLPGIEAQGAAAVTPLTGNNWTIPFERTDQPVPAGEKAPDVGWQNASGGYFKALQIPLRDGRFFDSRDRPDSAPVVIISESIARQYFRSERAVGRHLRLGDETAEIVGVVGDIRRASLTDDPRADMYMPFELSPSGGTTLFIRTVGDPLASAGAVREALRGIEPRVIIGTTSTLDRTLAASVASTTLAVWLMGLFAVIALLLAAVGVYGVMSYSVRQRTRELGTRVALGATPGSIVWMIVRQGLTTASAGIAIGVFAVWLAGHWVSSLLFEVQPFDPGTITVAVLIIGSAALVACYIPAVRASRVDAVRTL